MDGMPMPSSVESSASVSSSTVQSTLDSIMPTSTASTGGADNMGGMGDRKSQMGECKISMLWNWDTIDTCFLSESWHVKSRGGFAGLCIGVALLVILLEFLRRASRIYDQHLIRQHIKTTSALAATTVNNSSDTANGALIAKEGTTAALVRATPFRPKLWQQAIRALLHTLHFALAYWIMLLAMYYNGYIIICIILGAFIGFFILQWEQIDPRGGSVASFDGGKGATGCHG
ncbi:Ctr-domain-containing protein [Daldinia vernicosa]|uniref:Ctr-domain-containing protein n=1 Tax=Daldinia vernicosa TaxID=114800 RepID=UPI0020082687|nr:Ctr-domain-containing protein [Daldinia vernicosa]KAI0853532.1 Ctr-domain-containing protein [Daldinia vernicosa]